MEDPGLIYPALGHQEMEVGVKINPPDQENGNGGERGKSSPP
jgi:hypothetical protein